MKYEIQSPLVLFIVIFLAILLANITTSALKYIHYTVQMNTIHSDMNMQSIGNPNNMGSMGCPMMKKMMESNTTGAGMCGNSGSGSSSGMCDMSGKIMDMKTMTGGKN